MIEKDKWRIAYVVTRERLESAGRWGFLGGILAIAVGNVVRELYGFWLGLLVFLMAAVVVTLILTRHERKLTLELVGSPPDEPEHERIS